MIEDSPDPLSAAEVRAEFDALTALDADRLAPIGLADLEVLFWQGDRAEPHELAGQLARFDPDVLVDEDELTRILGLDRLIGAAQAERLRLLDTPNPRPRNRRPTLLNDFARSWPTTSKREARASCPSRIR